MFDVSHKALLVHERLCAAYGCPIPYFHDLDPLSELLSSLLSHRTRNAESGRAFKELRRRFAGWAAVRDAPTSEVESAIAACTWPELKAPRLQQVLRLIGERLGGELSDRSLDFLAGKSVPDARAWLEELPGVGPKTSAAVLAFSTLRKPALPVDSHHHRVARRLGLIGPGVGVGPAHATLAAQLPPDWDAQKVYDNHEALMLHGQRCCFHADPACSRCPVLDLCPFGRAKLGLPGDDKAGRAVEQAGAAPDVPRSGRKRGTRRPAATPPGSERLLWDDLPNAPEAPPVRTRKEGAPGADAGERLPPT